MDKTRQCTEEREHKPHSRREDAEMTMLYILCQTPVQISPATIYIDNLDRLPESPPVLSSNMSVLGISPEKLLKTCLTVISFANQL